MVDVIDMHVFYFQWINSIVNLEELYSETLNKEAKKLWPDYWEEYKKENYSRMLDSDNVPVSNVRSMKMNYVHNQTNKNCQKMNTDELHKHLDTDCYQKPWNRLKNVHKYIKIKDFIDELIYPDDVDPDMIDKNKKYLFTKIEELIEKKLIKQKDVVLYNEEDCKILEFNIIEFNKKKKKYIITE